jgi:uncharacterized membrane protein
MAFCASCGASVEGKFCAKCGTPLAAGTPPPAGAAPSSSAPPQAASGMSQNVAAALTYVLGLITGIIFLVLEPYNRDRLVRFHAFQSIFFNVAVIGVYIVLMIVGSILGAVIPFVGAALIGVLSLVVWLGSIVLWVVLIIKAYGGTKLVLPVIGPLAEKQA